MRLTHKELLFIHNVLAAKRVYRTPPVWEPWMESLLTKIDDELEVLS